MNRDVEAVPYRCENDVLPRTINGLPPTVKPTAGRVADPNKAALARIETFMLMQEEDNSTQPVLLAARVPTVIKTTSVTTTVDDDVMCPFNLKFVNE